MVTKGTTAMKTIHHLTITRLPVGKTPGKTLLEADFAAESDYFFAYVLYHRSQVVGADVRLCQIPYFFRRAATDN